MSANINIINATTTKNVVITNFYETYTNALDVITYGPISTNQLTNDQCGYTTVLDTGAFYQYFNIFNAPSVTAGGPLLSADGCGINFDGVPPKDAQTIVLQGYTEGDKDGENLFIFQLNYSNSAWTVEAGAPSMNLAPITTQNIYDANLVSSNVDGVNTTTIVIYEKTSVTIINKTMTPVSIDWPQIPAFNLDFPINTNSTWTGSTSPSVNPTNYMVEAFGQAEGQTYLAGSSFTLSGYPGSSADYTFKITPATSNGLISPSAGANSQFYSCEVSSTRDQAGQLNTQVVIDYAYVSNYFRFIIDNQTTETFTVNSPQLANINDWVGFCNGSGEGCDATATSAIVPANNFGSGSIALSTSSLQVVDITGDDGYKISISQSGTVVAHNNNFKYTYSVSSNVVNGSTNWVLTLAYAPLIRFVNFSTEVITVGFSGVDLTKVLSGWTGGLTASMLTIPAGAISEGFDTGGLIASFPNAQATITIGSSTFGLSYSSNGTPKINGTAPAGFEFLTSFLPSINAYTISLIKNIVWDGSTPTLKANNIPTVVHGFSLTTTEYALQGLGMQSFALLTNVNWVAGTIDFQEPNYKILDAIIGFLPQSPGVIPAIRIPLNAAYYLGVLTPGWSSKNTTFINASPSLPMQYVTLIDNIVNYFTSMGVVSIIDLHWNDDVSTQQPMALKSTSLSPTGDSIQFWNEIVTKYKDNSYVWYELYNEPYMDPSMTDEAKWTTAWLQGGAFSGEVNNVPYSNVYYGMSSLYQAIAAYNPVGMIVVGGGLGYAYDAGSLIQFNNLLPKGINNVIYNFHPYLGGPQTNDKIPSTFETYAISVQNTTNKPVMITEAGQYCCPPDGSCGMAKPGDSSGSCTIASYYTPTSGGPGYLEDILMIATSKNISWTLWAWNPSTNGTCCPIVVNNGLELNKPSQGVSGCNFCVATPENPNPTVTSCGCCDPSSNPNGCGADYSTLFPKYYVLPSTSSGDKKTIFNKKK